MAKKKKDTGYQIVLSGAKGILRLLIYICAILVIIYLGKTAYSFGYKVLYQQPVAESEEESRDITVQVQDGMSTYAIGKMLKNKGLIDESPAVFYMQVRLSNYYGQLEPGTYILNTYQTVDEMLAVLAQEDTEGQPGTDDEETEEDTDGETTEESVETS